MESTHASQRYDNSRQLIDLGQENVPIQRHRSASASARTRHPPPGFDFPPGTMYSEDYCSSTNAKDSTRSCRPAGRPLPRGPSSQDAPGTTMRSRSGPVVGEPKVHDPVAPSSQHAGMHVSVGGTTSYSERARTAYRGEGRFANPVEKADGGFETSGVAHKSQQVADMQYFADDDEEYPVLGRAGPPPCRNRPLHRVQGQNFRLTTDSTRPKPVVDTLERRHDSDFRTGVHETESLLKGLDAGEDTQDDESQEDEPEHERPSDSLLPRRSSMVQNIKTTVKKSFAMRRPSEASEPPEDLQNSKPVKDRSSTSTLSFHTPTTHSPVDPVYIDAAHPSAYWTGRFMSTADRIYHNLMFGRPIRPPGSPPVRFDDVQFLIPVDMELTIENRVEVFRGLETQDRLTSITMFPPDFDALDINGKKYVLLNEEEKSRRIFKYLASVCVNDTALNSLYGWQEMFARKKGNPALLPPGGTMKDSFMCRLFNFGPKKYV